MTKHEAQDATVGNKILTAVERLVEHDDKILALVDRLTDPQDVGVDRLAERVIDHYSTRCAVVGGATALPAMIPGLGTTVTLVAGPLSDVVLLLKYETEMCLALTAVHGHDIHCPTERQFAFLLAALHTAEQFPGSDVGDGLRVAGTSIYHYAPRAVGKLLVTALALIAAHALSKSLLRAVPLIGVAVGASMNKVLTRRVGQCAHAELDTRRRLQAVG